MTDPSARGRAAVRAPVFDPSRSRSVRGIPLAGGIRAGLRLPLLILWTLLCCLPLALDALPWSAGRARALGRARIVRRWSAGMLALLGVRIVRRGRMPARGCFLVTNHLGYLDILVLASQLDATFVAKHDIASWPVVGWLCRTFGTLFLDRARPRDLVRVFGEIDAVQRCGVSVVTFPEGTSSGGESVLPFHAGLFEAPARSGIPVAIAALAYATPRGAAPPEIAVCWWGGMTFMPHFLQLLTLRSIEARLMFADVPIGPADRRTLARDAHREVSRLRAEIA
jgi:1-acyl-sn-glycerol-3-phosphate acyltransferase